MKTERSRPGKVTELCRVHASSGHKTQERDRVLMTLINKILVVDDDGQITELLHFFLNSRGYGCTIASDGREAIEIAQQEKFDMVITDIKMPGIDGISLTRELLTIHPDIAVMVMTGFTSEYTEEEALNAGASDFIIKPFTLTELSARIQKVIREKKRLCHLKDLAFFDTLTGLPNRKMFFDRTTQALEHAMRYPHMFALLFLDIDNFKAVNDSFGHDAGDILLRGIATRLSEGLRKSETVARMSGDEFIVTAIINRAEDAEIIAMRICDSLSAPFILHEQTCSVSCSIGISLFPTDGSDVDTLMKKADSAMYRTKEKGGNNYSFYKEKI